MQSVPPCRPWRRNALHCRIERIPTPVCALARNDTEGGQALRLTTFLSLRAPECGITFLDNPGNDKKERTDSHGRKRPRNDRGSGVAVAPTENLCHCEPQRGVAISCCQILVLCWVRRWLSMTVPTSATCKQLHILGSVATILQRILFPVSCYVSPVSCQFYGLIEKTLLFFQYGGVEYARSNHEACGLLC